MAVDLLQGSIAAILIFGFKVTWRELKSLDKRMDSFDKRISRIEEFFLKRLETLEKEKNGDLKNIRSEISKMRERMDEK